jgi:thiol-disulfide isomerase/thioredoxin
VKIKNLIVVGGIVCLYSVVSVLGGSSKPFELSVQQWVTQNPPTSEEMTGHVRVVEFWATWCPPCREQIPHMKKLAKRYEDKNVFFIGLSADQSISDVRKFIEKKEINYHIGMDNGLSDQLGVTAIPMAFVISHEGKILWNGHPGDARFLEVLQSAVKAAPQPMLAGVEMGRFSHLRVKLCGGKNFAKAYTEVETYTQKTDSPDQPVANTIINTINEKLTTKIVAAKQVKESDPQAALPLYKEIVENFGGIRLTKDIETAYQQLCRQVAMKLPAATPAIAKAG